MNSNYNKKIVFAAACLAIFLFGMILISIGTIIPFIRGKFHLNEMSLGILSTILPFGILAGSLFFGPVADRYGFKILLVISVLFTIGAYFMIAMSGTIQILCIAFFSIGFGGGILNGTSNSIVSGLSELSKENKAANLSLMGVFFGIGALGMPFLFGMLLRHYPIETFLEVIGISLILPLIFFYAIHYPEGGSMNKISITAWLRLAATPMILLIGMIGFFQSGLESLVNNWITTWLISVAGFAQHIALFYLTLFVAIFTFTRLILSFVLRKTQPGIVLGISMTLVLAGIILLIIAKGKGYYMGSLILLGMGLSSTFPVITGHTGDLFKEQPGTAISIFFTISLLGNMGINYLTGWITSAAGLSVYPFIFFSIVVFTLLFILLFYRALKRKNNHTS
jgi:FHS family glucose/mannose:H+ symporter-like MFS transporter